MRTVIVKRPSGNEFPESWHTVAPAWDNHTFEVRQRILWLLDHAGVTNVKLEVGGFGYYVYRFPDSRTS